MKYWFSYIILDTQVIETCFCNSSDQQLYLMKSLPETRYKVLSIGKIVERYI